MSSTDDLRPPSPTRGDDPDAPATEEELRLASELRDLLEHRATGSSSEGVLRALAAAHRPNELTPEENARLVEAALARAFTPRVVPFHRRARVVRTASLTFGGLALAAAALLYVGVSQKRGGPSVAASFIPARSTEPLFDAPFSPLGGGAVARIDRIASVRGDDFRDNRFASWGVR